MESYYYVDASNKAAGPYDLAALVAQGINASTLVWKAGLSSWVPAAQVPEVAAALKAASQPTVAAASQTVAEPEPTAAAASQTVAEPEPTAAAASQTVAGPEPTAAAASQTVAEPEPTAAAASQTVAEPEPTAAAASQTVAEPEPTAAAASQTAAGPEPTPGVAAGVQQAKPYAIPEPPADANVEPPRDYLVWAILSTVFCCGGFSVSVAGLVMAILTRVFNAKGKYETSRIFSRLALYFTVGGAVLMALYLAIVFSLGLTSAALYDF